MGRLGLSALFGNPKRVATEVPFNIVLGTGLGAGFGAFRKFRPTPSVLRRGEAKIIREFPGEFDLLAAPQIKLRQIEEIRKKFPDRSPEAEAALDFVENGALNVIFLNEFLARVLGMLVGWSRKL